MYVYGYRNKNNEIIYVGSTQHIVERYQQHQHEDEWMNLVDSITVWGPYSHADRLLYGKVLIAHHCPRFSVNIATDCVNANAPILYQEGNTFDNLNALKHYFKNLPGETKRCTYYLYNEEDEALRMLSFYCDEPISELVRSLLHQSILERAAAVGHPDIFDEACTRLMGR